MSKLILDSWAFSLMKRNKERPRKNILSYENHKLAFTIFLFNFTFIFWRWRKNDMYDIKINALQVVFWIIVFAVIINLFA